jgi:hypothetical protein
MFDWRRNRENRSDGTRALKSPLEEIPDVFIFPFIFTFVNVYLLF